MLTDPAGTLIKAARERKGQDALVTRALLWLFVMAAGLPLAMGLINAASAFFG